VPNILLAHARDSRSSVEVNVWAAHPALRDDCRTRPGGLLLRILSRFRRLPFWCRRWCVRIRRELERRSGAFGDRSADCKYVLLDVGEGAILIILKLFRRPLELVS
jgi:hypothetical protein